MNSNCKKTMQKSIINMMYLICLLFGLTLLINSVAMMLVLLGLVKEFNNNVFNLNQKTFDFGFNFMIAFVSIGFIIGSFYDCKKYNEKRIELEHAEQRLV